MNNRKRIYLLLALPFFLTVVSCALRQPDPAAVDKAVALYRDSGPDCIPADDSPCFEDSPFYELINRAFPKKGGPGPHFVNIINHGDEALLARIHLIRSARKAIFFQTFICSDDEVSAYVFQEMLNAARRGVKIKLLIDQLGSQAERKSLEFQAVAHANLEIRLYNPTFDKAQSSGLELVSSFTFQFSKFNQRMHNKVLIVDNRVAITGGRNIENRYFDLDPEYTFKDRDLVIVGRTVNAMTRSFFQYWNYKGSVPLARLVDVGNRIVKGRPDKPARDFGASPMHSVFDALDSRASDYDYIKKTFTDAAFEVTGRVAFFGDLPGKKEERGISPTESTAKGLKSVFSQAEKSLLMQTPYLVFSKQALRGFKKLRKRNPDFQIIASTNSLASADHISVYAIAFKQKKKLLKKFKFRLHELKPVPGDVRHMIRGYDNLIAWKLGEPPPAGDRISVPSDGPKVGIHSKSFVVDDAIAWIGSHNFDPRSENLNTEAVVVIWDKQVAKALKDDILRDIAPQNSWLVARKRQVPLISYFSNIIGSISRALPIFDIWPFRYATSYELRQGKEPVPPGHPDFHDHYRAVGAFPGINLSLKAMQARLTTVIGGFAMPII